MTTTTTTTTIPRDRLVADLIGSIQNEQNHFDMSKWATKYTSEDEPVVSCETASCLAGHLVAIRPELLAAGKTVTGILRRLHATSGVTRLVRLFVLSPSTERGTPADNLEDITREDAISHVLGANPDWPQRE